jgi:hypothetical protein
MTITDMDIKKEVFSDLYLDDWYFENRIPEDIQPYITDIINTAIHQAIQITRNVDNHNETIEAK